MFTNAPNGIRLCTGLVVPLAALIIEQSATAQTSYENAVEQPIYKYTGNSFSQKFHRPSCKFARAMWRGHVVRFQYRKQAIDAGQKPCRYCLPPDWKTVGAKIMGKGGVPIENQADLSPELSAPSATRPLSVAGENKINEVNKPTATVPQLTDQKFKTQSRQKQAKDGTEAEAFLLETPDYRLPTPATPDFPFAPSRDGPEL